MIITRIDGGLGNQLFQWAYGLYLAERHGTELLMDVSSYASGPQHGYLLNHYGVNAQTAGPEVLHRVPRRYRPDARWQLRDLVPAGALPGSNLRRHKESPFGFHPRHLAVGDHSYLVGYWQSEQFFPGLRPKLLIELQLNKPLSDRSRRVAEGMLGTQSVAVHVRRGDYVNNSAAAQIYCHLKLDYYRRAVEQWAQRRTGVKVFVFSNDIPWCQQNLQLPWPIQYVGHNTAATAHEDLELLRQANCCVIANSTFSWWGAWLNERPDKVVYAPPQWFQPQTYDGSAILPREWQIVSEPRQQQAA